LELLSVFASVFIAELGDKTQIATLLFAAATERHPALIFVAAAAALVLSTALAVFIGAQASHWLERVPFKAVAGAGFLLIGAWLLFEHFKAAA
jgi:putative Ca2+/H+ antiporter (TMEM165/GDT1 family)